MGRRRRKGWPKGVEECSRKMGIGHDYLRAMMESGEISSCCPGVKRKFRRSDLEAYFGEADVAAAFDQEEE